MSVPLLKPNYTFQKSMEWYYIDPNWCVLWSKREESSGHRLFMF